MEEQHERFMDGGIAACLREEAAENKVRWRQITKETTQGQQSSGRSLLFGWVWTCRQSLDHAGHFTILQLSRSFRICLPYTNNNRVRIEEATQSLSHPSPHHIAKPGRISHRYLSLSDSVTVTKAIQLRSRVEYSRRRGQAQCESIRHSQEKVAAKWWRLVESQVSREPGNWMYDENYTTDWQQGVRWFFFFYHPVATQGNAAKKPKLIIKLDMPNEINILQSVNKHP